MKRRALPAAGHRNRSDAAMKRRARNPSQTDAAIKTRAQNPRAMMLPKRRAQESRMMLSNVGLGICYRNEAQDAALGTEGIPRFAQKSNQGDDALET